MAPEILNKIFQSRTSSYNLRINSSFSMRQVYSVHYDTKSLSFLGPKIRELVPDDITQSGSIEIFLKN